MTERRIRRYAVGGNAAPPRRPAAPRRNLTPRMGIMGFANTTCGFTRFRITDPVPDELWTEIEARLKRFAFQDIDGLPETQSWGWVCFDDMLDSEWRAAPPRKGAHLFFSLRLDMRRIPAAVAKKHLTIALREERRRLAEQDKKFISRERKKELREQTLLKLRERFLPVPAEFNVIWSTDHGEIWFASTRSSVVDLFMELFQKTFELRLEQITPHTLALSLLDERGQDAVDRLEPSSFARQPDAPAGQAGERAGLDSLDNILGQEFLTWLWHRSDAAPGAFTDALEEPFSVSMEQRIVVQGGEGDSRETASVSGPLSPLREARFGLGTGKKVVRALIRLEKEDAAFQLTLKAEDFSVNGLKTPRFDAEDDDEPDAALLGKVYFIELCVALLDGLFARFLELRLDADRWREEIRDMGQWMARTE